MWIKALQSSLIFFDMDNVFKIVPTATVDMLKVKLEVLFVCQKLYDKTTFKLLGNTSPDQTIFL